MVTGWLPEKTGSARQRLREAEADHDAEATGATDDDQVDGPED